MDQSCELPCPRSHSCQVEALGFDSRPECLPHTCSARSQTPQAGRQTQAPEAKPGTARSEARETPQEPWQRGCSLPSLLLQHTFLPLLADLFPLSRHFPVTETAPLPPPPQAFQALGREHFCLPEAGGPWEPGPHGGLRSTDEVPCDYLCTASTSLFLILSASIANSQGSRCSAALVTAWRNLLVLLAVWDLL